MCVVPINYSCCATKSPSPRFPFLPGAGVPTYPSTRPPSAGSQSWRWLQAWRGRGVTTLMKANGTLTSRTRISSPKYASERVSVVPQPPVQGRPAARRVTGKACITGRPPVGFLLHLATQPVPLASRGLSPPRPASPEAPRRSRHVASRGRVTLSQSSAQQQQQQQQQQPAKSRCLYNKGLGSHGAFVHDQ
ncbi:hypothetical protein E2C01_000792 [Portunus trituberculatus]|uniref:Uncharacterized protein n=1 Tax=Portunus trituberculatus TaxID=210409 RepID=A0A5B7CFZ8_PORTR|nr:hypothetical protein [Portunus trituberculatus]